MTASLRKLRVHVRKRARSMRVKIYNVHEISTIRQSINIDNHVTSCKQINFEFRLINIPIYFHFSIPFVYCSFYSNTKILPIKICLVCPRIFSVSYQSKVFKFQIVIILSLNYRYVVIICVLLLSIKVIRSRLRSRTGWDFILFLLRSILIESTKISMTS